MAGKDLQQEGENRGGSSGYYKLGATVVPLLLIAIPMVLAFLYLRQKQHRVYAPRTFLGTLKDEYVTLIILQIVRSLITTQGKDT